MYLANWETELSEVKSKSPCNAEGPRVRIFEIIPPEVEIEPEDLEDIPHPQGVFPVDLVGGGNQGDIGRTVQGDILIGKLPPGSPQA